MIPLMIPQDFLVSETIRFLFLKGFSYNFSSVFQLEKLLVVFKVVAILQSTEYIEVCHTHYFIKPPELTMYVTRMQNIHTNMYVGN